MRFLMLNWRDPKNPKAGGAERVSLAYLNALARRGHEVYWFAFHFPGAAWEEKVEGVHVARGGGPGTAVFKAWAWHRRQKPFDLVIDQHHGIPWFAPWWSRTRCVSFIHEVLGPIWDSFYAWPWNVVGRFQERCTHWLYRNCVFWTASSKTKEQLRQHGVRRVVVHPYGVETRALPELPEKTLAPPLRLTVASRLAANKRIDHALRLVHVLRRRGVESHLTVLGEGEEKPALRRLRQELGLENRVEFRGWVEESEKLDCMKNAHFLVHTSVREGWGLNVIEANAMGAPAAVYPVDGLVESTLKNETGLVAGQETPESLADEILGLLKTRPGCYETFRVNAWERAKQFHWNQVLPPVCDWLESQARPPGSSP